MANTIQKAAVFGNTSAEARRRVIGLYRAWYRDVSTCASIEWQVLLLVQNKKYLSLAAFAYGCVRHVRIFWSTFTNVQAAALSTACAHPNQAKAAERKLFLAQGGEMRGEREKHHADQSVSRELSLNSSFRIHAHSLHRS